MNFVRKEKIIFLLMVSPALLLLSVFFIWPLFNSFWISFHTWPMFGKPKWVGLDNYIYTLNEVENTDVFDELEDENQTAIDNLFDDETPEVMIEITMVKNATINGKKLLKDTLLEVTEENANKLVEDGKAKLNTND